MQVLKLGVATRVLCGLLIAVSLVLLPEADVWSDGATQTAEYSVHFDATWSAATHPSEFPPGPHFSGLIGATHHAGVSFWEIGQLASPGIEAMAETGAKSILQSEIQAAINATTAGSVLSGGGISLSPGSVSLSFTIDLSYPLVSLVSMIAPSPDWFVGVSGLSLLQGGNWVNQKTVQLFPYDSGTDNGMTYTSANNNTNPPAPITLINTLPVGNGTPLGTFTFTRLDATTPVPTLAPALFLLLASFLGMLSIFRLRRSA